MALEISVGAVTAAWSTFSMALERDREFHNLTSLLSYHVARSMRLLEPHALPAEQQRRDLVKKHGIQRKLRVLKQGKPEGSKNPDDYEDRPMEDWSVPPGTKEWEAFMAEWKPISEAKISIEFERLPSEVVTTPIYIEQKDSKGKKIYVERKIFTVDEYLTLLDFIEPPEGKKMAVEETAPAPDA